MQATAEKPHAKTLQLRHKRCKIPFDILKGTEVINWRIERGTLLIELENSVVVEIEPDGKDA